MHNAHVIKYYRWQHWLARQRHAYFHMFLIADWAANETRLQNEYLSHNTPSNPPETSRACSGHSADRAMPS